MKFSTAIMATLCCLTPASNAFVATSPRSSILGKSAPASRRDSSTTMLAGGAEVSTAFAAMQTSVLTVAANGIGEPGTVDAPGWVLPVGAGTVILLAGLIPLVLKPGDDAAKDMQERDANIWEQNRK